MVMAFYIELKKFEENEQTVCYSYCGTGDDRWGKVRISKSSDEFDILQYASGDQHGSHAKRALMKLVKLRKSGEFPDITSWAS